MNAHADCARSRLVRRHNPRMRSIKEALLRRVRPDNSYRDLGGDYFSRRDPQRLVAQLQRVGHTVTIHNAKAA